MNNNRRLMKELQKNVNKLQNIVEHRKIYNIRNTIARWLIKSGIAIDYILPFILSGVLVAGVQTSKGNPPFHLDEIERKARIETIDTSSGIHLENTSYDYKYDEEVLEYSTGWIVNEKGLYERDSVTYRLNGDIDLSDKDIIFQMSKEEIENLFVITNERKIMKNSLDDIDKIYNTDALIIIDHTESKTNSITSLETESENTLNSILFIGLTLLVGFNISNISKIFIVTYPRDILKRCVPKFRNISLEELEEIKKILELKQENLNLLNNNINDDAEHNKAKVYTLRKQ